MTILTEAEVEAAALAWLESLGWCVAHRPDVAPGVDRGDYGHVILASRLRDSLATLNPNLQISALDDAFPKLTHPKGQPLKLATAPFTGCLSTALRSSIERRGGGCAGARSASSTCRASPQRAVLTG